MKKSLIALGIVGAMVPAGIVAADVGAGPDQQRDQQHDQQHDQQRDQQRDQQHDQQRARATGRAGGGVVASTVASSTTLDDATVDGLVWMRAEEQLAHDVYVALGEMWDLPVFDHIAASEARHVDAVIALLDAHGIDDVSAGNPVGTFDDPTIQALYDTLVDEGSTSLAAALGVGARIEELDIRDLRDRSAGTTAPDVLTVYANLEQASISHLDAFVGQLDRLGVDYEPSYLPADEVDDLVAGTPGRR